MKRKFLLIITASLLLFSVSCARLPAEEPTGETTDRRTETSHSSTPSQTANDLQETQLQDPTEQTADSPTAPTQTTELTEQTVVTESTEQTQPTQNDSEQDSSQSTQETIAPDTPTDAVTQPTQPPDNTHPEETIPTTVETESTTPTGCLHDYQQTYTKAATCTTEGTKKFTCSKCGAVTRQQIPVKEHTYKAATCLLPKICIDCSCTEGSPLGHSYGTDNRCIRCGAKDPNITPESMPVDFVATIRSDEGVLLPGVTVTVYTAASGADSAGSAVTNQKGVATIPLRAGGSKYTVELSNVPEGYQVQQSYSFSTTPVTINLKTLPVRTDPNDHSKARYVEGDQMMEFTITDVDGNVYRLSQLLQENKLVILDFWYVSCNPCKKEFPYFEAALKAYGDDVVLLAVDPFYSVEDIRQLRDEMALSFPVFQDPLGLAEGFRVESYPTTVFIDSTGTIRKIHRKAFSDETSFLRAVAAYL